MIESVAAAEALPRISPLSSRKQKGGWQGTGGTRAPSPNFTPTVLTPSPAVSVAGTDGAKVPAQPVVSGVCPGRMRNVHGNVPSLSTSTAYWSTSLDVPAIPLISGSPAVRLSVTSRLFVAAAPPSICTVPLGGVASTMVSAVESPCWLGGRVVQSEALSHAETVMLYRWPSTRKRVTSLPVPAPAVCVPPAVMSV